MIFEDAIAQAVLSIRGHRLRSSLTMLGIAIGIASVILLTSIGEGARVYIASEFTQFGTSLISLTPGKVKTTGGLPGVLGNSVHKLTLADAEALTRVRGVEKTVPMTVGSAAVQYAGKSRDVLIYGVTSDGPAAWHMDVRVGRFLPPGDPRYGAPVVVLGPKLRTELFGPAGALGQHVHVGGRRFLVIGVMAPQGQFLGFDIDDAAYIPVGQAQSLFNRDDLREIDVLAANASVVDSVVTRLQGMLTGRHEGQDDFTITTQTGMLETFDRVLRVVSLAVSGIAAISLLVGAIGILTMMWISVNERTSEIGLAKAVGATPGQILGLYLCEAAALSLLGGTAGLIAGFGLAQLLHAVVPGMPVHTPLIYVVLALLVSLIVGLLSGILPARRAARLDPVEALAAE